MDQKYILFVATEVGLGHLLTALLNSAYYAWRTGRVLALDMRDFHYFQTNRQAAFFEHFGFEFPAGLAVITDLAEIDRVRAMDDLHYLSLDDRLDLAKPFANRVVLVPCLTPGEPFRIADKREDAPFRVVLRSRLLEEWNQVMSRPVWSGPVIGLHYRSAIGEVTERMTRAITPDYEERYRDVKDRYVATALSVAKEAGYENPAFLVTSDDASFVSYVRERLPNSFSLAARLPDQEWAAWVRAHGHDPSILIDAVNDLWCLSACDHLVHYRSGFSHFAILNSRKLGDGTTHYVHVPALEEILRSLGPEDAVVWARGAVRKANLRRMQTRYLFDWLADALDRVGATEEAAHERQRAQWHWECHHSPIVETPERPELMAQARRGDLSGMLGLAQRAVQGHPDNPFWLAGYPGSLSNILAQMGRVVEAIPPAQQAAAMEPGDPFLHAHLGTVLSRNAEHAAGEQSIRRAIAIDPDVGAFHFELGLCLLRQNRLDDSLQEFHAAVRLEPDNPLLLRQCGSVLVRTGKLGEAEAVFREAIALREDAGAHIDLSDCLARQGRMDEAIAAARVATELEASNPHWLNRVASLLLQANRPAEAEAVARRAVAIDASHSGFQDTLAHALERQGRLDEALAETQRAAAAAPGDAERQARLGNLLLQARRHAEAVVPLTRAASLQPQLARFHDLLATAWERQQKWDEAAAAAQRSADLEPQDAGRRSRAGQLFMSGGRNAEAEAALRQAIALNSEVMGFHHMLSIVLHRQDRLPEAIEEARRAVELTPDSPELNARLASLLLNAGQTAEVEPLLRAALTLHPDNAQLNGLLCGLLEQQQRIAEAIEVAHKLVALQPEQWPIANHLAGFLLRTRQSAEAEAVLRTAIARHPAEGALYESLSHALTQQGRTAEAAAALGQAAGQPGASPRLLLHYARLCETAGDLAAAAQALQRAIAADPNSDEARAMLAAITARRGQVAAPAGGEEYGRAGLRTMPVAGPAMIEPR